MAKLNLDNFKNNARTTLTRQETQGIFKEHHNIQERIDINELFCDIKIRILDSDLQALRYSIETLGQIEPITVHRVGERYEILNGNRRLEVAKLLNQKDIAVNILHVENNDALFLPYLLNCTNSFDIIEVALYLQKLKREYNITDNIILEKLGLHVEKYSDLFSELKGDVLKDFNTHYDALLHKYFKLKDGAFDIEKNGINLKIAIDTSIADEVSRAEVYRLIHKLSNL